MFFEGKYYKHQINGMTACMIEGHADDGKFLQVIANDTVYYFDDHSRCRFSERGVSLDLPKIKGEIQYSNLTPLKSDIMGFYRFFPMQCRHSIISMNHDLTGGIEVEGKYLDFTGGRGYIEGDKGHSFPKAYLWLHCNDFDEPCSIMVSVADIPFLGFHFLGCICAIVHGGKEYRLATYRGVKVQKLSPNKLVLSQKKLRLELDIDGTNFVPLKMPVKGKMAALTHECNTASVRFQFYENEVPVFDLKSDNASYECFNKNHSMNHLLC